MRKSGASGMEGHPQGNDDDTVVGNERETVVKDVGLDSVDMAPTNDVCEELPVGLMGDERRRLASIAGGDGSSKAVIRGLRDRWRKEGVSGAVVGDGPGVTDHDEHVVDSDKDAKDDEHAVSNDEDDGGEKSKRSCRANPLLFLIVHLLILILAIECLRHRTYRGPRQIFGTRGACPPAAPTTPPTGTLCGTRLPSGPRQ